MFTGGGIGGRAPRRDWPNVHRPKKGLVQVRAHDDKGLAQLIFVRTVVLRVRVLRR